MKRIMLLTNICFEPYWKIYINSHFSHLHDDIQIDSALYEDYQSNIDSIRLAEEIVICLNIGELYPNISNDLLFGKVTYKAVEDDCIHKCRKLYSQIRAQSNARVIWFGFEDYYCRQSANYGSLPVFDGLVDRINLVLSDMLEEDIFIDFKRLIATVGIKKAYDTKGKYRWNAPYSKELINLMVDEIYKQYLIENGNTKKCLVLDCDNVLWGGILSEDGIEGIQISSSGLGRSFQDFQRFLLDMYYHGVILTVCSKNDEADVLKAFREHSGMLLNEEHISCFRCNWNNKPENIINISQSLNIGLDSIVFVDDSDFEIQFVRSLLPQVVSIKYDRNTIFDQLSCFNLKCKTDIKSVTARVQTYKTNAQRRELQSICTSYADYLDALEMKIDIHMATPTEWNRIAELTQRTNKCTNGSRYSLEQLKKKLQDEEYRLFSVSLSDKFSDLGIVGAIGLDRDILDLFCLSCRALGRNVEENMFQFIKREGVCNSICFDMGKNEAIRMRLKNLY